MHNSWVCYHTKSNISHQVREKRMHFLPENKKALDVKVLISCGDYNISYFIQNVNIYVDKFSIKWYNINIKYLKGKWLL